MTGVTYQTWHHGNAIEIAGCCGVFLGNNLNEKTLCVLSTDVTSLWCVCVLCMINVVFVCMCVVSVLYDECGVCIYVYVCGVGMYVVCI